MEVEPGQQIIICADNDGPDAPSTQAIDKAVTALTEQGAIVEVRQPEHQGQDFNDVLKQHGREEVAKILNIDLSHFDERDEKAAEIAQRVDYLESRRLNSKDYDEIMEVVDELDHIIEELQEDRKTLEFVKAEHPETYQYIAYDIEREYSRER